MRRLPYAVVVLVAALAAPGPAAAALRTFDDDTNSHAWDDAVNWDGNVLPVPADDIRIADGKTLQLAGTPHSASSVVQPNSSSRLIVNGTTLTLTGSADSAFLSAKVINGGTVVRAGTGRLNTGFSFTPGSETFVLGDTDGAGSAAGTLEITGDSDVEGTVTEAAAGTGRVHVAAGAKLEIDGFTTLTLKAGLVNEGTVRMPSTNALGGALFLIPGATPPASSGTFLVGDGAGPTEPELVVQLVPGVNFTLTSAGAVQGTGLALLQGTGGAWTLPAGGAFTLGELRLLGGANAPTLALNRPGTVGALTNSGSRGGSGALTVTGPGTSVVQRLFTGTGATTFAGPLHLLGMTVRDGATVKTNGTTTWDSGLVWLGEGSTAGTWRNAGAATIAADGDQFTTPAFVTDGTGVLQNTGSLTKTTTEPVPGQGVMTNSGTFTLNANTGTFGDAVFGTQTFGPLTQSGGTTRIESGATLERNVALQGGVVMGTGAVRSIAATGGTVRPGLSPGTLTVLANYSQVAPAQLETEITGTAPGSQFDVLAVHGTASLGGTLSILSAGFVPAVTDTFAILTATGGRTGQWGTVTGASAGAVHYLARYAADGASLCVAGGDATTCGAGAATTPPAATPASTTPASTPTPAPAGAAASRTPPAAVPAPAPPAPAPPAPPAPISRVDQAATFPSARACASRRRFAIRLRVPRGANVTQATVKVNGRRIAVRRGDRLRSTVNLTRLPKGRFTVAIELKLTGGRTIKGRRRYRTCTKKLRGGRVRT